MKQSTNEHALFKLPTGASKSKMNPWRLKVTTSSFINDAMYYNNNNNINNNNDNNKWKQ